MATEPHRRILIEIIFAVAIFLTIGAGISIGLIFAATKNIKDTEAIGEYKPALPSQILDRKGRLITELFSEEKRDIISIDRLPKHLIYALTTREDRNFFEHKGFDLQGLARALINNLLGRYHSGGSTITQQVAGRLYDDRSDISYRRKIRELWWAVQLERSLTKNQILEIYLNNEYYGHNVYGIEAASQFYFGHSARDVTLAESVMLVIQLSSPARNSPINHPEFVKNIQAAILLQMVELGYTTQQEADLSFYDFWESWDYTRSNISSAYFENESKAPYFTEYVRLQLEEMLYGALDVNRDGFIIHTTLDLDYQEIAEDLMSKGLHKINATYQAGVNNRMDYVNDKFVPLVDLLAFTFNLDDIRVAGAKQKEEAMAVYEKMINPTLNILSMLFSDEEINFLTDIAYAKEVQQSRKTTVEGALITLENDTGRILAMVGGSEFKTKKYNRAVQSEVMPGSAFKPLYYSAAISSRKFTPSTLIYDSPVVFWNDDGTPYIPLNYMGEWKGPVRLRRALAHSMNVPSLQVLDGVGFDAVIDRASKLLGISDPEKIASTFPRRYPLGLGIIGVAPIQMARAFATFPNQGREVVPIAISYIEDRYGNIILEPEKELRAQQKKKAGEARILPPEDAYIMVDMLQSVVEFGTLMRRRINIGGFDGMPMAGKTGTTQNWSDAWTVGFSPYMTTAVWFGFDIHGASLGINQTGATAAGPIWAEYMKKIHASLPPKEFERPGQGITEVEVCAVTGLLPTADCDEGTFTEIFLTGTEPRRFCDYHPFLKDRDQKLVEKLKNSLLLENFSVEGLELPELKTDLFSEYTSDSYIPDQYPFYSEEGNPLLD